ncbi:hypothetical protein KC19_9G116600 [Ceratodon purpureus]|uniref:Fucosyltransferase n=1 Tax=Ceratodon purpureus TaxID=3225 RepID=A0A8T0GYU4_CERPU|nr:hypothetical protein KC19_9G116600 [Ceratodon purpureus]
MKEGKTVPFWRNGIVLMSIGTVMIFTCLLAMDMETVDFASARISSRKTAERTDLRNAVNREMKIKPVTRSAHDRLMNVKHDPECLARTQHLLYRRDPERFAPSPAFTKAWNRYVMMHKACSHNKNWTHVFLHERGKTDDCNYLIVMEGNGGTGNKLLSLTSAFAYGLATDRVVMVEGRNQFKYLLCDPFPESSWFLPEDFPYQNVTDAEGLGVAIQRNFTDTSMVTLRLDHIQSWADTQFFCEHTHFGLMNVRWVGWSSTQYFVTRLLMVPSIWERLNPLFPSGEIFTFLSHKVLLPKNELWAHIVRLYFGYLAGSSKRVGVQVRLHGRWNLAEYDPVVFDHIVDCLQSRDVLPKLTTVDDVSDVMSFARNGWESSTEISVLVTSLQLKYYDELKDLYAGKPNVNKTAIRFHMVSHLGSQDSSVHQGETAFVEMWLLSFSDVLAISAYSTFGYVPQGIGGVKALYLNIKGEVFPNSTSCFDAYSTQPCTHNPQDPKCEGPGDANELHSEWMRHHVRECVDHPGGLQLVNEVVEEHSSG